MITAANGCSRVVGLTTFASEMFELTQNFAVRKRKPHENCFQEIFHLEHSDCR